MLNLDNEAIECFDKAIEINPNNAYYYFAKGKSFEKLNMHQEATQLMSTEISVSESWLNSMGVDVEQFNNATASGFGGIQKDDLYYFEKGNSLQEKNLHNEAIEFFNKAIDINPNDERYYISKSNSLKALGKFDEANKCTSKAIARSE
jgi:tetratricopeptide (TPR) repeat protein